MEQIQEMTNEEIIATEDECMRKNAWRVCDDNHTNGTQKNDNVKIN